MSSPNREQLLEAAFREIPSTMAGKQMRRLSAASFSLLGNLGSPMITGVGARDQSALFNSVSLYVWVHTADLDLVCAVEKIEDIPANELKKLGFEIEMPQALSFLESYKQCAARMAAALAEVDDEEDEQGKSQTAEQGLTGMPRSLSPSEPLETQPEKDTSSGFSPSNEVSPTCTPSTSPTEPGADGPALILPDLMRTESKTPPEPSKP
jgi:hypothetical protein